MNKTFKVKHGFKCDQNLAGYASLKIGGKAEYFYCPANLDELVDFLKHWQVGPVTFLGAFTNVLIRDGGLFGLVVCLQRGMEKFEELDDDRFYVEAGVHLPALVKKCTDLGMVDAAFMSGIPGTVGGALKMNAGAYGDSIWNYVKAVKTINRLGEVRTRKAEEFNFSYRSVEGLDKDEWFVAAELGFFRGEVKTAKKKIKDYLEKRISSQPLDLPNCGSVFRNPKDDYAARLIEQAGFKGKRVGGAEVSKKHANFIVNCGGALAIDVEALMKEIILSVEETSGVKLIPEVEILGNI